MDGLNRREKGKCYNMGEKMCQPAGQKLPIKLRLGIDNPGIVRRETVLRHPTQLEESACTKGKAWIKRT